MTVLISDIVTILGMTGGFDAKLTLVFVVIGVPSVIVDAIG